MFPRATPARSLSLQCHSGWLRPTFGGLTLCFALNLGCSSEAAPPSGSAGTSAQGSGGTAGASGASGTAGTANTAGATSIAGSGGSGGGKTDAPGTGGAGGGIGGGSAGQGGAAGGGGGASGSGGGGSGVQKSDGCGKMPALESGKITVQSGGGNRTYVLRVPEDYDNAKPYRLILGFHGATGNANQVAPSYFGLWNLSQGSTIFAAPDAVGGLWAADDDLVLIDDIITQLGDNFCIDTKRIALEGFSQGGAMAWTAACARPGKFSAAIVHSGGGLARPMSCEPIPFFSSLGVQESGGKAQASNSDFFAMQNGCTVEPLAKTPSGGHACSDYEGCPAGSPTRWCDYDGGHTAEPRDAGQNTSWMPEEVWKFVSKF